VTLANGVKLKLGQTAQAVTTETLSHYIDAVDGAGNAIKLAVVS
jgi:hypothetical protein